MKENVLEVLMYLFDYYLEAPAGGVSEKDLANKLKEVGFACVEINRALVWLDELADVELTEPTVPTLAMRVFTEMERFKLDLECQGYLLQLEEKGLITPPLREIILDRVMAIGSEVLGLAEFRRVVGLVVMNQATKEARQAWAERLIYNEFGGLMQ